MHIELQDRTTSLHGSHAKEEPVSWDMNRKTELAPDQVNVSQTLSHSRAAGEPDSLSNTRHAEMQPTPLHAAHTVLHRRPWSRHKQNKWRLNADELDQTDTQSGSAVSMSLPRRANLAAFREDPSQICVCTR